MEAVYTKALWGEIKIIWIFCLIAILFFSVWYVISIIWKDKIKDFKVGFWVGVPFLLALAIWSTAMIHWDIREQAFISEHVEYHHYNDSYHALLGEYIYIENDAGKTETLILGDNTYPEGDYTGTVTYTKHCKIILNFVPDEPQEENIENEAEQDNKLKQ